MREDDELRRVVVTRNSMVNDAPPAYNFVTQLGYLLPW